MCTVYVQLSAVWVCMLVTRASTSLLLAPKQAVQHLCRVQAVVLAQAGAAAASPPAPHSSSAAEGALSQRGPAAEGAAESRQHVAAAAAAAAAPVEPAGGLVRDASGLLPTPDLSLGHEAPAAGQLCTSGSEEEAEAEAEVEAGAEAEAQAQPNAGAEAEAEVGAGAEVEAGAGAEAEAGAGAHTGVEAGLEQATTAWLMKGLLGVVSLALGAGDADQAQELASAALVETVSQVGPGLTGWQPG